MLTPFGGRLWMLDENKSLSLYVRYQYIFLFDESHKVSEEKVNFVR